MPVGAYPGAASSTGNGVTTVFAYNFRILAAADLKVTVDGVVKVLTTDYAVSGVGDAGGGNVTFVVAPANGALVVRERVRAYSRATDYQRNGSFDEQTVDADFDSQEMQIQQIAAAIARAFKAPVEVTADQVLTTAQWAARHSMFVGFDAGGNIGVFSSPTPGALVVSAYIQTLLDDADAATARATLGAGIANKGGTLVGAGANAITEQAAGSDGYPRVPSSGATLGLVYAPPALGFNLVGGYLDWTVAGSVLTVAVKTWGGNDPSDAEPVFIPFRSATAGTGSITYRKLTAAASISINDTALLGTVNSIAFRLWCVAFDDGGTVRLAIINCLSTVAGAGAGRAVTAIYPLRGWGIASSTLEDNASDSAQVFYSSGAAVAAKAYATLGYATWETGLAAAGTWSAAPTRAQLYGAGIPLPGDSVQPVQRADTGAVLTGTTTVPADDTIPQNTEGDQYLVSPSFSPSSAANVHRINAGVTQMINTGGGTYTQSLYRDTTANALAMTFCTSNGAANLQESINPIDYCELAGATAATQYKLRAGSSAAGTTTINGSGGARLYGGVANTRIHVEELMA